MSIEYGAEVIDRNGKVLGTVDYIIRNAWTGEISKFRISQNSSGSDILMSPDQVLETADTKIKVNVTSEELTENNQN
jgi:sporulation protein YlmC with PRC-barrel domain